MKTFKIGGIHPEENKLAKEEAIEVFPIPKQVTLFVTQHLGAPSTPIVQAGDKVKVGQLVATAQTLVCANLHSPVSGTVVKVEPVPDMTGYRKLAITIDVEDDIWEETIDTTSEIRKEITLTKPEIIERIKACGVVGLGGACFPTHVKYMVPPEKKVDYIIVNGAECEPYITTDHRIMLENGEECLIGVQALLIASGAPEARIGIEANKPDAFEHLQRLASQYPNIKVFKLKTKYPQGAEKQLIKSLTGREVPNGKLPIEVGCIVNNITTTYAIYEAVQKNKPLIETYTTISGKRAKTLKNYKIRLGTSISEVLSTVGIPENTGKIVSGGPMMGKAIANINSYFVKGMSSLLFIDESESKRGVVEECIRCGKCVTACPMGLEPYLLYALATRADYEECEKHGIMNCIECGSCQYGCPAFRPLLDMIRVGKNKTGYMIRTRNK
ncbi:MAG TPA: electron transport complex subunit RsxC [Bacteroidales bacterium]|jgi:electron transport complex protein RnfC|nr:electron transport complex subunit RsxC [Bacteroidales bacterium]